MMTSTPRSSRFSDSADSGHAFLCGVCELDGFSESYKTAEERQAHWNESGHCRIEEWLATKSVKRTFPGATELSEDDKRAAERSAPEYRAPGTKLRGRQYGTGDAPATEKQKSYAIKLGINPAGMTKAQISKAIDAAKKTQPVAEPDTTLATPDQLKLVRELLAELAGNPDAEVIRDSLNVLRTERALYKNTVAGAIDMLQGIAPSANSTIRNTPPVPAHDHAGEAPTTPAKAVKRITNKYPGKCGSCGQKVEAGEGIWQIDDQGNRGVFHLDGACPLSDFGVPTGRYAIEHEGTLKFYNLKSSGLYVMASDEEHKITKKASQVEIIDLIKIDPMAAMRRYGHEIGKCGRCGRTLTDEVSRANGIGPICESKAWG